MTKKIVDRVAAGQLQLDLEKYRQRALELGATDAKIITTDMVIVDSRVRAKCINPKCHWYGTNASCPPNGPDLSFIRDVVGKFHYGIFYRIEVPTKLLLGGSDEDKKASTRITLKNHEIASKIESEAFYDGYYLAQGLANGSCKALYCRDIPCNALEGNGCRHPLRARGSIEGWSMDAYRMAVNAGWDIYPIGGSTTVADVPHGTRLGLILVY